MASICVYCGSSPGNHPDFLLAAQKLGAQIAASGHTLVYGGGNVGLMGAVADAVLEGGGKVIGVIPKHLADKEIAHPGLSELHVVESMHERKQKMAELADAFIALPGGTGTLEEIIEVFVWLQLGLHQKPCALLNVNRYYDSLASFIDQMADSRFLKDEHREQLLCLNEVDGCLETLLSQQPVFVDKWLDRKKS
ncbi:TIGR00730 family Rossman fold protein [Akkermansiaceae bacterium]|nr:TIGR00730 family Rossman fold protein [Akkermansiaceae bacterium]